MKKSHRTAEQQLYGNKLFFKNYCSTALLLYCSTALFMLLCCATSYAFDVKGLQPLPPYGVFSTFSAESLKQNKVGFGLSVEKSYDPNFYRTVFNLAYGIHDKFEMNITLPYVAEWENRVDGFEDVSLGVKHRVIDEGKYWPAAAYILTVSPPSGKDEFTTEGRVGGGLLLTKKVGPFKGHFNAFYSKPDKKEELKDEYAVNLGAELAVTHDSKVLVEVVGRKNHFKNKIDMLEWRLGYRIATTDYMYTTIGAGFDIKNRTPDYRLMFSVSVILPPEKKRIQRIYEE
ncbi:MAG: hypothetical protein QMD44_01920 [Thermodesulfovibrionales bacterium]|jgi:hypothetical protein|nr:hypothetical protein [Thermodesulfovibrionales bacterium]